MNTDEESGSIDRDELATMADKSVERWSGLLDRLAK